FSACEVSRERLRRESDSPGSTPLPSQSARGPVTMVEGWKVGCGAGVSFCFVAAVGAGASPRRYFESDSPGRTKVSAWLAADGGRADSMARTRVSGKGCAVFSG